MKRVRYLTAGLGCGGIDGKGRWRPSCFWLIQRRLGDLMSRVGRQRSPIRRFA